MDPTVPGEPVRVLFVDDEPNIRFTMPEILQQHGYIVTAVGTVNEALGKITSTPFDVLISDLNIGEAGDGFTVVSAMRRTQPKCITLILTGYPGFESALDAIRRQVDDYLIKPTPIPELVKLIESKLKERTPPQFAKLKRVSDILRESSFEITKQFLTQMKSNPLLGSLSIADEDRVSETPRILEDLALVLDSKESEPLPPSVVRGAEERGRKRYVLGYTIPMLAIQIRLLERAIYNVVHQNLSRVNLSYFMFDLKRLDDTLGIQLEHSLTAYLEAQQAAAGVRTDAVERPPHG